MIPGRQRWTRHHKPPPPWEAQRPLGVKSSSCLPAVVGDLCCRGPDGRHVYVPGSYEWARRSWLSVVLRIFVIFSHFDSVWIPCLRHFRKRSHFDLRFAITILFGHAPRDGLSNEMSSIVIFSHAPMSRYRDVFFSRWERPIFILFVLLPLSQK